MYQRYNLCCIWYILYLVYGKKMFVQKLWIIAQNKLLLMISWNKISIFNINFLFVFKSSCFHYDWTTTLVNLKWKFLFLFWFLNCPKAMKNWKYISSTEKLYLKYFQEWITVKYAEKPNEAIKLKSAHIFSSLKTLIWRRKKWTETKWTKFFMIPIDKTFCCNCTHKTTELHS